MGVVYMLRKSHKNKKYSEELRMAAVEAYFRGEGSQREICERYEILATHTLRDWIMWYNGHKNYIQPWGTRG